MAAQERTESPPGRPLDIVREGDGDPRHGRYTTYNNHTCRCTECREAWTQYNRDLRRRRREQAAS
jgi:hypothetical protein